MFTRRARPRLCAPLCRHAFAMVAIAPGLAAAQGRATVVGVVRDSVGGPVIEADVSIAALRILTRTNDSGLFTLRRVQPGGAVISVRRLGYRPQMVEVDVRAGVVESLTVVLQAAPLALPGVTVSERELRRRLAIEDFYRRRARGIGGAFVTREEIEARHASRLSDVLRDLPALRFVRTRGGMGVRFVSASTQRRDCVPMVWLDGVRAPGIEVDEFPPSTIEGIELYAGPSTTPLQFSQSGITSCGTIVIWSRVPGS